MEAGVATGRGPTVALNLTCGKRPHREIVNADQPLLGQRDGPTAHKVVRPLISLPADEDPVANGVRSAALIEVCVIRADDLVLRDNRAGAAEVVVDGRVVRRKPAHQQLVDRQRLRGVVDDPVEEVPDAEGAVGGPGRDGA